VDLRYGRLTSELISLSVGSELTFYAVLDSFRPVLAGIVQGGMEKIVR